MNYLKYLLSLLCIGFFVIFIEAQQARPIEPNATIWGIETDISSWERMNNQIELLKSGNDILKLRLEVMELQIGKLGHYFTGIDQKLQNIDDKLELALKAQLAAQGIQNKLDTNDTQKVKKLDNAISENLETADPLLEEAPTDEISKNTNSGENVIADLLATEKLFMTDVNGEEGLKVCSQRSDKSLMCSDITLPTSCANATPDACWNNKCYIQNNIYGTKPFWVSCNDTIDGGGWTVIQRRIDGSVDFLRNWDDYKKGFGELDGEFWIGLDKLYALTNDLAPVELYVHLTDFDKVEKYAKYDNFAIGDEASKYVLKSLGAYSGDAGNSLGPHERMKFTTKDQDNDNYWGNCVDIRHGAWWYDNCAYSNLNGRYFKEGTHPIKGDRNGVTWYEFHSPDYSMKSAQMMIRPKKA